MADAHTAWDSRGRRNYLSGMEEMIQCTEPATLLPPFLGTYYDFSSFDSLPLIPAPDDTLQGGTCEEGY